ncbi:MAG: hypothetical protein HYU37_06760 [Acidobacteria bacterium]|nr:hypothetical protein [Acidobacteriota bacterium]
MPVASFGIGQILARRPGPPNLDTTRVLLALAIAVCVLALPLYSAFRYFAAQFALAVYRDFYTLIRARETVGAGRR